MLHCANCGLEFGWQPTWSGGRQFCCPGCAEGGPCNCDYARLPWAPEESREQPTEPSRRS